MTHRLVPLLAALLAVLPAAGTAAASTRGTTTPAATATAATTATATATDPVTEVDQEWTGERSYAGGFPDAVLNVALRAGRTGSLTSVVLPVLLGPDSGVPASAVDGTLVVELRADADGEPATGAAPLARAVVDKAAYDALPVDPGYGCTSCAGAARLLTAVFAQPPSLQAGQAYWLSLSQQDLDRANFLFGVGDAAGQPVQRSFLQHADRRTDRDGASWVWRLRTLLQGPAPTVLTTPALVDRSGLAPDRLPAEAGRQGRYRARLTTAAGAPVAGRTLVFSTTTGPARELCRAVTGADGVATCPATVLPGAGHAVVFAGDPAFAGSRAEQAAPVA